MSTFKEFHTLGTDLIAEARVEKDPAIREALIESAKYYFKSTADSFVKSFKTQEINQYNYSGGKLNVGDNYDVDNSGMIGTVGTNANAKDNTFTQTVVKQLKDDVNQTDLINEIESLLPKLREKAKLSDDTGDFATVAEAGKALKMAQSGNTEGALQIVENLKSKIEPIIEKEKRSEISNFFKAENSKFIDDITRAKIVPWKRLPEEDFTIVREGFGGIEVKDVLRTIEKYGICLIRLQGQAPGSEVAESVFRLLGQAANRQNDFTGEINNLKPEAGIEANTGSSAGDLGFHVDGTQSDLQPALLMFQYVVTADIGGNSRFVDMAKVLLDMDEETRIRILTNLARNDAAEFNKKGMKHLGPVFSFPDGHSLACRIRYDSVMTCHPDCQEDYRLLKEATHNGYENEFKPLNGDIIIFDNWRLMHARTTIHGNRQRHHRRVWLDALNPEHQANYKLGIRPVDVEIIADIKKANK